jgi:HK97 gp10 family phage protein
MNNTLRFSLIGLERLQAQLRIVNDDLKRQGGRFALRKAANLVVDTAKDNARRLDDTSTGRTIADNIALRWNGRLFKRTGDLGFRIGVLQGARLQNHSNKHAGAPTPHWRLLEFGTETMPAQPFLRRALADQINEVTDIFISQYEKALDRVLKAPATKK